MNREKLKRVRMIKTSDMITDKQISKFISLRFKNLKKSIWKDEMKAEFDLIKEALVHFNLASAPKPPRAKERALRLFSVVGMFFNSLKYVGKNYYCGNLVGWLLEDKKGKGIYCDKCGNIANGIEEGRVLGLTYRIPLCKKHLGC